MRRDAVTALLGCWVTAGVSLDAWARVNTGLDSFFTAWHSVFVLTTPL